MALAGSPQTIAFNIRVVAPPQISVAERALWDSWCSSDPMLRSAFYSYAYARAVAEVRPHVYVAVFDRDETPVGFLPFQYAGVVAHLLRAAEPVGGSMTDYFGIIAAPGFTVDTTGFLRGTGLASFLFSHLDESQIGHGLCGEQPEIGLRIEFKDGAEAYWNELRRSDKRLVADTERRIRRLSDVHGPLRFQMRTDDPGSTLDLLIAAKRRQYARTGARDSLEAPWKRALLHRLGHCEDRLCRAIVSTLYAGDVWVASHVGLQCGDTLHYWFPVYNDELRVFAPGRLLLKAIIDGSAEQGIAVIDRGAGDTPAKRDFANASHLLYRGLWHRAGGRALAFRAAMSLKWRMRELWGNAKPA